MCIDLIFVTEAKLDVDDLRVFDVFQLFKFIISIWEKKYMFEVKRRQIETLMNGNEVALVTALKLDQSQKKEVKSPPK